MSLPDISYIIPLQWYQRLFDANGVLNTSSDVVFPTLGDLQNYIQPILSQEKQAFLKLVGQKVNYLQIDNLVLNHKQKTSTKWKTVSHENYQLIKKKLSPQISLPIFASISSESVQKDEIQIEQQAQFKLIKLLLCSFTQNHLFYGYIDRKVNSKMFIQSLLETLEYFYTEDTKATFLESNQFRNYKFQDENLNFQTKNQLIMIHGLERYDQKIYHQPEVKSKSKEYFKIPFQSPRPTRIERNGEQMTMADQDSRTMSQHTMSTGAETPFTFGFEDQDWDLLRPYHKNALFGEKLEEEIQNMKEYARQAIYTNIIQIPTQDQEQIMSELEKLAQDIEENIQKKRMYQKQIVKDTKEYLKETHHTIHFKDREVFSKQLISIKDIESEQKSKQSIRHIVYFSSSNENN